MLEQLHNETVKATSAKRIGSIAACLALNACDIGEAVVANRKVTITWGRNLSLEQQAWYMANTDFRPVHVGSDDGTAELIIPPMMAKLLSLATIE